MALNRGFRYRSRVEPEAAGGTLLAHLALTWRHSNTATWQDRLRAGELTLDGAVATGGERLQAGQEIAWARPPWDEPDVPLGFSVVHADDHLLIVDKPSGLPTMPAGGFLEHTLWTLVRQRWPEASPMHRLGRHTSGLVVFSLSAQAARALGQAWREHRVVKDYRALGSGHPVWDSTEIATPIGAVPHPLLGRVFAAATDGKAAHSEVHVEARRDDGTLFRVRITTGRPHQIRIHLAFAGHPLVGDPLYAAGGLPHAGSPGLPGDGGYHLHAHRLCLPHPSTGEPLWIEAPPPAPLA